MQWIHTLIFYALSNTGCEDILVDVKRKISEWIKYPSTFDTEHIMIDLTNLYINYGSTVLWDVQIKDSKSKIIALETAFKKERVNNYAHKNTPGTTIGKPNGLTKWRFKHTGKDKLDPEGNNLFWCKKHDPKGGNVVQSRIYMPAPYDHEQWQEINTAENTAWGGNQKTWAAVKHKATDAKPAPR